MLWEEFRSRALPLLGERFPSELIKDNGDSLTFVDRRERLRFFSPRAHKELRSVTTKNAIPSVLSSRALPLSWRP